MDLKEEAVLGDAIDRHWYYLSKARMLSSHLKVPPEKVLDVGAGAGWFSRWLLRNEMAESAVCVDPGYPEDRDEVVGDASLAFRRVISQSDADLVLMMDVLEHVDDDIGLLREYLDKTQPGTRIFITVPAFEFLWSGHDDFLEHRRRYTVSRLRAVIEAAGATPECLHYYYGLVFPAAAAVRLIRRGKEATQSDMAPMNPVLNGILQGVCSVERLVMRANRLAGLSVVAMCRR